jgi:hypothetical protein
MANHLDSVVVNEKINIILHFYDSEAVISNFPFTLEDPMLFTYQIRNSLGVVQYMISSQLFKILYSFIFTVHCNYYI